MASERFETANEDVRHIRDILASVLARYANTDSGEPAAKRVWTSQVERIDRREGTPCEV